MTVNTTASELEQESKKRSNEMNAGATALKKIRKTSLTKKINYWLMKAEPESRIVNGTDVKFSIDDLKALPNQTSPWDGVRNYEARNIMRDRMKSGDQILFYHSNCKTPGVTGIAEVVREGYPDASATDPNHPYYDKKSQVKDLPKWFRVDVKFVSKFKEIVSLKELKKPEHSPHLQNMTLLKRPQLSVQPVSSEEFNYIYNMAFPKK